jgi:hypothetical protein
MIDLTQPPNIIQGEILKLPLSEQQYWIDLWMAQMPSEIKIPTKTVPPDQNWQDVEERTTDALDRPRAGKFGRKEKQEYAKNKQEKELEDFLNDPVKVKQTARKFKELVARERERLGLSK